MWIKVCGVTDPENAAAVADCGVDALGLNFYPKSKRAIDQTTARAIIDRVGRAAACVGLFVNEPAGAAIETARRLGLRSVQLHADDPRSVIESLRAVRSRDLIVTLAVPLTSDRDVLDLLEFGRRRRVPFRLLLDAAVPGEHGGTGQRCDWAAASRVQRTLDDPFGLLLAGGLTPGNVGEAVRAVQPSGVDVASGVESSPGTKDIDAVRRFVAAARAAASRRSETADVD